MYEDGKNYHIEKEWEHCGLKCVAIAVPIGHRCGYVGVDNNHPCFSRHSDDTGTNFDVHGGITYTGMPYEWERHDNIWWIGFDCAHSGDGKDFSIMNDENRKFYRGTSYPAMLKFGEIRTLDFVVVECNKLAEQLADMLPKEKPLYNIESNDIPMYLIRLANLEID